MATERVYDIKVNGADSMNELKSAVSELTEKLKSLDQTSKEYLETLKQLTDYQQKLADAMGGISDSAEKTDNSLNGIKETVDSVADSISSLGEDVINSFAEGLAQGMAEAATETAQMGESMDNGVNSVKGLKQEISDLRDKLVTLDNGTDEYKETVQQLINDQVKLKEVMNAGKNETQAAEGSYNALTQRMSALKQVWKETTDEATRNEIGQQINEINNQLKALDASIGNSQRNVGNYKSALEGLDDGFVNLKTQLRECKEAMQQLDPASEAYNEAMMRAAEITHQLSEQQEQIKYASTDVGDQLENVRGIATNMAAGFSAVNAAMGLFGEENEEVQQAMLKVQQAMALVQGLQGLDGFIKRTKGLSQSMGLVTKATQANTVATKANATAAKADATAKAAETVATKAAVPAQLSLNAAMKANPIGFIVGLIATLVTAMMLLKDKIMEMIGSNKEMSAAFDKVKAVLSGFGNVIKKSIINPIKMAIIPIKTLAKVMIDLFKGDWTAIGDDIKAGFEEMKDNVVDTINVVGAFKEGYDKKTAEQAEAARKKEAEERSKEKDAYIKDMEAKYGSTWKFTEDGEKAYQEYFKSLKEMYDEDTEEFKQAQRDQWAYEREMQEKRKEDIEKQEKAEADANKKQEEENKRRAKAAADAQKKALESFKSSFEKFVPEMLRTTWSFNDLKQIWESSASINAYKKYLKEVRKLTDEEIDILLNDIKEKWVHNTDDNLIKALRLDLEKSIYDADKKLSAVIEKMTLAFQGKEIFSGVTFPKDIEKQLTDVFQATGNVLKEEEKEITKQINEIFTELTKEGGNYVGMSKQQIGELLPEFQKLLDAEQNIKNEQVKLLLEYTKSISDVYKKDWQNRINIVKEGNQAINDIADQNYKELINNAIRWQGVYGNALRDLYEDKDYYTETYKEQKGQLERLQEMYLDMANDEKLTFEEKENAKREAAKITGELIQLEYEKEVNMLKVQKGLIKEWANAFKDAASSLGDTLATIGDYYTGLMELEKQKIDQELEAGKISDDEAKKRYEQQKKSFEQAKNLQLASTWINGFSAAIGAYQSMASIPYVGPVLGAAAAAAALATTAIQAQKIKATTFENPYGGGEGGGSSSTNFQLPSVLELEPNMGRNTTNQSDIDELNNAGNGRGKGESAIRAFVVESEISASQELANKRSQEVTF